MNLLNLISLWLDIICQVTTKCATVAKLKFFSPTKHTRKGKREGVGCKSALTQNQISLSDRQVGYILMMND